MSDPIEDLKKYGIDLEPDIARDGPYHRTITHVKPIPNTRAGNVCTLSCGHIVQAFGRLELAENGKVLCTECRRLDEHR